MRILLVISLLFSIGCAEVNEVIIPKIIKYHVQNRKEIKENNTIVVYANENLIIEGDNFNDYNAVYINNFKCEIIPSQSNSHIITVKVTDNAVIGKIRVNTTPKAVFSNEDIIVKKRATFTSISPLKVIKGDKVTVSGNGFLGLLSINIGSVNVPNFNVISDQEVSFLSPQFVNSSKITFKTTSGTYVSPTVIEKILPPSVEVIRPLQWTKKVIAVINGANINTTTSVVLNSKPIIINEKDTALRIKVSLDPNLEYTSGHLVFTNPAGTHSSRDLIEIIKTEVLAQFSNLSGTYFKNNNNYVLETLNSSNGYYDTAVNVKSISVFFLNPKLLLETNTTAVSSAPNKKAKFSIKLSDTVPQETVMFQEMKGTTIDNYTLKIHIFNDNGINLDLQIITILKDPSTNRNLRFASLNKELTGLNAIEQKTLTFKFSELSPMDSSVTTNISSYRMVTMKGIEFVISPPASHSDGFKTYIESVTLTGPAYD